MIGEKRLIEDLKEFAEDAGCKAVYGNVLELIIGDCIIEVEKQPKIGEWIPCSERLPENEQEVEITYTRRDCLTGETLYLTARAIYEDGTLSTENSAYCWSETDNWEYDEKTDSYVIPEGWWESVSFSEEFGIVDMPVIAWRTLPDPYRGNG